MLHCLGFDFLAQNNIIMLEVDQIQLNLGEMGKEDLTMCSCPFVFHTTYGLQNREPVLLSSKMKVSRSECAV